MSGRFRCTFAPAVAFFLACAAPVAQAQAVSHFDLPAQPLADSLRAIGSQTNTNLLFDPPLVAGHQAQALKAELTVDEALTRLLSGTEIKHEFLNEKTVVLAAASRQRAGAVESAGKENSRPLVLARAQAESPQAAEQRNQRETNDSRSQIGGSQDRIELEEIIVTGTHIVGAPPVGSPVMIFSREDIERSGVSTAEQFIQKLPQNFNGGVAAATAASALGGEGSSLNGTGGTGINLRGLGNASTLTLINGRRISTAGIGSFVDLTVIPLAAIERIEVMSDGASAIYGSDAVAGVVNFVTRKDFSGVETQARYGTTTETGYDERQFVQAVGGKWRSGGALLSYEYDDRSGFDSSARGLTAGARDPSDVVGSQRNHSVLLSARQDIGERFSIFADGLYGLRTAEDRLSLLAAPVTFFTERKSEQYSATLGGGMRAGNGWSGEFTASYSDNYSNSVRDVPAVNSFGDKSELSNNSRALEAKVNGALFTLPAGEVKLALGAHYREERFEFPALGSKLKRDVQAAFGELLIPVIDRVDLSAALRYEEYSDFGSTVNPKVGLKWDVAGGLSLRGSFGTSFRAPLLYEISPIPPNVFVTRLADPTSENPANQTVAAILIGFNSELQPEEAENWTVGLDFVPESLPGLSLNLTYFNIAIENRIQTPATSFLTMLQQEILYSDFILRNPSLAQVNAALANAGTVFYLPGPVPAGDIRAILDNRTANVALRDEDGIDFSVSYGWDTSLGAFHASLGGTYGFSMEARSTPMAESFELLNTPYWPVDLRLRNSLGWSHSDWTVTGYVNYVDSYQDDRPSSRGKVDSWTTVDLTVRYAPGESSFGWLRGTDLSLSLQNMLDEQPPYVFNANLSFNYDATNANITGRFISLQVRKSW